jgi:hypothetical protein
MQFILMRLSTANTDQQLFHPLVPFIPTGGFMPGEIAGTAIQLERQRQHLQL